MIRDTPIEEAQQEHAQISDSIKERTSHHQRYGDETNNNRSRHLISEDENNDSELLDRDTDINVSDDSNLTTVLTEDSSFGIKDHDHVTMLVVSYVAGSEDGADDYHLSHPLIPQRPTDWIPLTQSGPAKSSASSYGWTVNLEFILSLKFIHIILQPNATPTAPKITASQQTDEAVNDTLPVLTVGAVLDI
jgi:hypothetical protein